jgi:hypothetical protein
MRSTAFRCRRRSPNRFTIASARHRVRIDRMFSLRRRFTLSSRHFRDRGLPCGYPGDTATGFRLGLRTHQIIVIVAEHYMRPQAAPPIQNPKSKIQSCQLAPRPNAVRPYTGPRIPSPESRALNPSPESRALNPSPESRAPNPEPRTPNSGSHCALS